MARDGRRANTSGNNQANDLRAIYGDEDGTVINAVPAMTRFEAETMTTF
jgi:hypothetical protein